MVIDDYPKRNESEKSVEHQYNIFWQRGYIPQDVFHVITAVTTLHSIADLQPFEHYKHILNIQSEFDTTRPFKSFKAF